MNYETYREHLNDVAVKLEEYKQHNAEYEEMINNALEYINGFKVAGTTEITCFNKITGRYESVDKDLKQILCGVKGINGVIRVNGWERYLNTSLDLLQTNAPDVWTIDELITIIDSLNTEVERLKEELQEYTDEYDYSGELADEYYERTKLED